MSNIADYIWAIYNIQYGFLIHRVDTKPQHISEGTVLAKEHYDGNEWHDCGERIYGPWFLNDDRTVKCKLCFLQDHTDNADLDGDVHKGFTVGKGKRMYFMYTWHGSGNATLYSIDGNTKRYVKGDAEITIHFK